MATDTTLKKGGVPAMSQAKLGVMENTIDFSVNNAASADIIQVLSIPAKTLVLRIGYEVITAEGGALDFDIGDDGGADWYLDGGNGNSAGSAVIIPQFTADATPLFVENTNGKYYTTADTIDITVNAAADAAKIRVWVLVVDVS